MFIIEDEIHAEQYGEFSTLSEAIVELYKIASIPWDEHPNKPPCQTSEKCGREYEIIEYSTTSSPWEQLQRISALSISAEGVRWDPEFLKNNKK